HLATRREVLGAEVAVGIAVRDAVIAQPSDVVVEGVALRRVGEGVSREDRAGPEDHRHHRTEDRGRALGHPLGHLLFSCFLAQGPTGRPRWAPSWPRDVA